MNDIPAFSASTDPSVMKSSPSTASVSAGEPLWADPARKSLFEAWLARVVPAHQLRPSSLRVASSDAGFRRYLRMDTLDGGSRIIMDAPPALENCAPFVKVAGLAHAAGLNSPEILDWNEPDGFMLLSDLGQRTMLEVIDSASPHTARPLYLQAVETLIKWQLASKSGVLAPYEDRKLLSEMQLFPEWYLTQHRGISLDSAQQDTLRQAFDLIVARNLAAPKVYVHRDFMPRNLMPSPNGGPLGVLDFQDALHGPITYDIASLMRDAFISWDEEFVLDLTVLYWERAKKAGLMEFEDWSSDFGSFWRAVEWMGLQRHLKVAGIFARLSLRDGKPKYLADTPRFINYIRHTVSRYRELAALRRLIDDIEGSEAEGGWAFGRM